MDLLLGTMKILDTDAISEEGDINFNSKEGFWKCSHDTFCFYLLASQGVRSLLGLN